MQRNSEFNSMIFVGAFYCFYLLTSKRSICTRQIDLFGNISFLEVMINLLIIFQLYFCMADPVIFIAFSSVAQSLHGLNFTLFYQAVLQFPTLYRK